MEACDGTCSLFKIYTTALLSNSDRPALFGSCAARVSNADVPVLSAVVRVMLGSFIHDRGRFWQRSRDSGFFCLEKAPSLETCAREYLVASGYVTHGAVIITMVAAFDCCYRSNPMQHRHRLRLRAHRKRRRRRQHPPPAAPIRPGQARPCARGTDDACKRQWRGSRTLAGPPSPTLSVASYHGNDKQTVGLAQLHSSLGHFGGDLQPVRSLKRPKPGISVTQKAVIGPARVLRAAPSSPRQFHSGSGFRRQRQQSPPPPPCSWTPAPAPAPHRPRVRQELSAQSSSSPPPRVYPAIDLVLTRVESVGRFICGTTPSQPSLA